MPTTLIKDLKVLYEDNHLIIVLKDEGILSQSNYSTDVDLLSIVKEYIKEKYQKEGNVYIGLVHRLDRRVGGLMIFAKTSKAAARLSAIIREQSLEKKYLAIVTGNPPQEGELVDYLKKVTINNQQISVETTINDPKAKKAILHFKNIKTFTIDSLDFSILSVDLITGRYNQIRKQLSLLGFPIVNDFKYGYRGENYYNQLGLFCYQISFNHPIKKEIIKITHYPSGWFWEKLEKE